jgi:hypothetical protein
MIPAQLLMAEIPYAVLQPNVRPTLNTWAGLQGTGASGANTTGAATVSVGQFVVAFIHWGKTTALPNLTAVNDTLGNTWTFQVGASNTSQTNKHRLEIWTSLITNAGSMQLQATLDAAPAGITVNASIFDRVSVSDPFVATPTIQQNDSGSSAAPSGLVFNNGVINGLLVAVPCGPGSSLSQANAGWTEWGGPLAGGGSGQDHFKRNFDANYTITGDWAASTNWMLAFAPLRGVVDSSAPSAVLTTFTFTASGNAAESHLYDNDDTTPAADPTGLTASTAAAYDFGSAKAVRQVRLKSATANGFASTLASFSISYSDTSLSAGFTDTGVTVSMEAGTSKLNLAQFDFGSHRFWRIKFAGSTSLAGNAWVGELTFQSLSEAGLSATNPTTSPTLSSTTPTSTTTASHTAPVTSNNGEYILIFAHRCFTTAGQSGAVTGITDARGNTYTRLSSRQTDLLSHQCVEIWGARNNGASGTFNTTVTWSGSGDTSSVIAQSWANVNTTNPIAASPAYQVNDSDTGVLMTIDHNVPYTHCRVIEFGASTEDTSPLSLGPTSPSGYGSFTGAGTSSTGTGTNRSAMGTNSADTQTQTGAATIATGSGAQVVRRFIYGALYLKGT